MAPRAPRPAARAAQRPRRKLVYSLLAVLVFVALAPLASFGFKLIETSRRALETSTQEIELQLASSIAARIDSTMDGLTMRMQAVADSFGAAIADQDVRWFENSLERRGTLADLLEDRLTVDSSQLTVLRLTVSGGQVHQAIVGAGPTPSELENAFADEQNRLTDLSAESLSSDPAISEPILTGPQGRPGVIITVPIMSGRSRQGWLQGFVSIDGLWDPIIRARVTGHEVYALDLKGNLLAHSEEGTAARRQDYKNLEIVQRFLTGHTLSKETVVFSEKTSGGKIDYLGAYDSTRCGWGIFVQVESRVAAAPIQEMIRDTVWLGIVALLLAVVVAVLFAGGLSRPIAKLSAASAEFARGKYSTRVDVKAKNEIGQLAGTFNDMAGKIEDDIKKLNDAAREMQALFEGTILALAQAIDAKDPYTAGHTERVEQYAIIIAKHMNLDEKALRDVHVASVLHDIGKIGIEDTILKKPANLTPAEFEVMKQHPEKGARIMEKIDALKDVIPGMRHHHERYGGGGYPKGLAGEEIPLIARVINVADTLDAMTTDRPYQSAFTWPQTRDRINELKGTVCDPKVVEAFNRAYVSGELQRKWPRAARQRWGPRTLLPRWRGKPPSLRGCWTRVREGPAGLDQDSRGTMAEKRKSSARSAGATIPEPARTQGDIAVTHVSIPRRLWLNR